MSLPAELQPSDHMDESDGSVTEDEDTSPSNQKQPALSLSGDLSCGLWHPICHTILLVPHIQPNLIMQVSV